MVIFLHVPYKFISDEDENVVVNSLVFVNKFVK